MPRRIRVGVVGVGGIGDVAHLPNYAKQKDVEITAICDVDEKRLVEMAEKYQVPNVYTDYRKMMELAELDGVSVCTPNSLHGPVSIAAFKAGKHVCCEKPLAMTAREAEKMLAAAEANNCLFMVGFTMRFNSVSQAVKKLIDKGALGEIYYAKAGILRQRGIPGFGGWFTTASMAKGGALIDIGVHVLDLALWLMGSPEPVAASGQTWAKFGPRMSKGERVPGMEKIGWPPGFTLGKSRTFDVDDMASGLVRFRGDAALHLEASWCANVIDQGGGVELFGTKGGVKLSPGGTATVIRESKGALVTEEIKPAGGGYDWEMQHFVQCIRTGKQPLATAEQGLRVMKILDAVYKSAARGKEVAIR
ncbi:MAG: hypothetical protein COW34_12175 [Armatimonadetes bacterium CG17_big_fil_post_rev_8_21_14_2_50_66_6]|nr:MAG: hypothetical protein COW34_12175 [Armatimonadetes bacterium CG17_big_fil_post_rev_8_21_14_2_50_66_6]